MGRRNREGVGIEQNGNDTILEGWQSGGLEGNIYHESSAKGGRENLSGRTKTKNPAAPPGTIPNEGSIREKSRTVE